MTRRRLDLLLVARGLAESQEKAQRLIRAGLVHTTGERLDKPGHLIDEATELHVKGSGCPYVSRGGLKLAGALDAFAIDPTGAVCLDLGASTGGFTDCLLQRGAARVHAIDVGRGQLHRSLELDERVVARERTHLDALEPEQFDPRPSLAVADLSFISLRRAYPVLARVLAPGGQAVVLVKPQFEAPRADVPPTGVITDPAVQQAVVTALRSAAEGEGFAVLGECESPIAGGEGNREFFLHLRLQ
ncbi:MAG: rRNA (cytidine1920-2-O)/16S rRNA (cytidine1409-2-O)-methyltransferase [Candidatus Sumerlaeota bacterium]|nr:rRNA (cytidine1920-2-O)/16S rRNA (cytidine1409-2-O)-methyltransferase [Candidatus Sumerlaeota bacterium]